MAKTAKKGMKKGGAKTASKQVAPARKTGGMKGAAGVKGMPSMGK